jgi:hypothetical protein
LLQEHGISGFKIVECFTGTWAKDWGMFVYRNKESPMGNGDKGWEEGDGWEVDPLGEEIEVPYGKPNDVDQ